MTDLDPAVRARRKGLDGTPVSIAGREWLLAGGTPDFGEPWDRLYDDGVIRGRYDPDDVRMAAARLLLANYLLTAEEAVGLVLAAAVRDLVGAVEAALYGPERPVRSWSDWALASLIVNGIRPAEVPPELLHPVLEVLVAAGRTVPAEVFVTAQVTAAKRAGLLKQAEAF